MKLRDVVYHSKISTSLRGLGAESSFASCAKELVYLNNMGKYFFVMLNMGVSEFSRSTEAAVGGFCLSFCRALGP